MSPRILFGLVTAHSPTRTCSRAAAQDSASRSGHDTNVLYGVRRMPAKCKWA
jgi:hypothetical protein